MQSAMRTKEEYESDMALLRKLEDDTQWDVKPAKTNPIDDKHLTSDGWDGARAKLGLSKEEWGRQVGGIPDDVTHITCYLSLRDQIRRKFGLKPKDEMGILVR